MKRKGREGCSVAAGQGGGFIYFVSREFCPQGLPGPHRLLLLATRPAVPGPGCLSRHSRLLKVWELVSSNVTSFGSFGLTLHVTILTGACPPLPGPPCLNDAPNFEPQRRSWHDADQTSCACACVAVAGSTTSPAQCPGVEHFSPSIDVGFWLPAVQGQRPLRYAHSPTL